ncbi:MAG: pyridoxal phosphate-dependent aminotransferase [Eudoraea sp.]
MYRKVEESQTLLINTQSKNLAAQNKELIKFGFGQSPFLPPKQVMDELKSAVHHKEYSSVQGDLELRQYMADFHKAHNGLTVLADDILIGPGSKILIFNTLMAFEKADVFIPTPSWVSYGPQAKLAGHNIIQLPTDFDQKWRISAESLKKASKHKLHKATILILNYPGNPDGLTYSEGELKEIADQARIQNIYVISDEIYGLLNHNLNHKSFANYYPEKTITTTGLSKWCGAGGWRFGAVFLPNEIESDLKKTMIGIGSETYSCAPTPVQIAARTAYKNFQDITWYIKWQVNILSQIGNYCSDKLNSSGIRVHKPQGGFYIFPDFSLHQEKLHAAGIKTSNDLCQTLLKDTGVVLLPAHAFGFEENYLAARLAYVDFIPPLENSHFDVEKNFPKVKIGIDAIIKWIENI